MRLPLATTLQSRDGTTSRDAKMKNGYALEDMHKRPGANDLGSVGTGVSQMLACWNGLLTVISDALARSTISSTTVATPVGYGVAHNPELFWYVKVGDIFLFEDFDNYLVYRFDSTTYTYTSDPSGYPDPTYFCAISIPGEGVRIIYSVDDDLATWRSFNVGATTETTHVVNMDVSGDGYTILNMLGGAYLGGSYFLYLSVDDGVDTLTVCYSSANGVDFTLEGETALNVYDPMILPFNGGLIAYNVGVGIDTLYPAYTSADGITWTAEGDSNLSNEFVPMTVYDGRVFTALYNGLVYSSTDGVTFSEYINLPGVTTRGATWADDSGVKTAPVLSDFAVYDITNPTSEVVSEATATPVADLTPVTPTLQLFAEATGATQSAQQLLIKSSDQAWIYTQ